MTSTVNDLATTLSLVMNELHAVIGYLNNLEDQLADYSSLALPCTTLYRDLTALKRRVSTADPNDGWVAKACNLVDALDGCRTAILRLQSYLSSADAPQGIPRSSESLTIDSVRQELDRFHKMVLAVLHAGNSSM
jgi:hypothetical protein